MNSYNLGYKKYLILTLVFFLCSPVLAEKSTGTKGVTSKSGITPTAKETDGENSSADEQDLNAPWRFDFTIGEEYSSFNNGDDTEEKSFSNGSSYIELSGKQVINEVDVANRCDHSFNEFVRFGRTNVEQEQKENSNTTELISKAETISAGIFYVNDFDSGCNGNTSRMYWKMGLGFVINEDNRVNKNILSQTQLSFGLRNISSSFSESFVEMGVAHDQRFIENTRLLVATEVNYRFSHSWRFIFRSELNAGQGADDFRVVLGLRRNFKDFVDITSRLLGFKPEPEK